MQEHAAGVVNGRSAVSCRVQQQQLLLQQQGSIRGAVTQPLAATILVNCTCISFTCQAGETHASGVAVFILRRLIL